MSQPELHFVISAPRSGSTWLTNALNQHPQIFATENRLFGNFCEMWPNNNGNLAPRITFDAYARAVSVHFQFENIFDSRNEFTDDFIAEYLNFLLDYAGRKTGCAVVVDKITPYPGTASFVIQQIQKFVPGAKIFQLIRDGRDVLTSGTFDWLLKDGDQTGRYRYFVEQKDGFELQRFFDDDVIEKWAKNWKGSIQAIQGMRPAARIKYEDMASDFSNQLQTIFRSLEIDSSFELAEKAAGNVAFEKTTGRPNGQMDPTAKQRKGVVGDWRNFMTQSDGQLFHRIAGELLISEGYESDLEWYRKLPESLALKIEATGREAD